MRKSCAAIFFISALSLFISCFNSGYMSVMEDSSNKYAVTYDVNGATGGTAPVDDKTYFKGESVTVYGNTGDLQKKKIISWKNYYVFGGWNTKADGKGALYAQNQSFIIDKDYILYARWVVTASAVSETGITASDGVPGDEFSWSMSLSGDGNILAVGAHNKNSEQGKAYIYRWNGTAWVETGISASDGVSGDGFGYSIRLSKDGNTLAVGAVSNSNYQGKIYIYRWGGTDWLETGIINGSAGDGFGWSLSLSDDGNTIAVGASCSNYNTGKVYIYKWNGAIWEDVIITASDGVSGDFFGSSVCLNSDGSTIAVRGSINKAYMYRWNGVAYTQTIFYTVGVSEHYSQGVTICLSGDGNTMAIGASEEKIDLKYRQGKVYIFKWNGTCWLERFITASDGYLQDCFGQNVSLSSDGDTLAVGAVGKSTNRGKAYMYMWNGETWVETYITASTGEVEDLFGVVNLSSDGNILAVGAYGFSKKNSQGKVYIYR